jgi:hypothetical protein
MKLILGLVEGELRGTVRFDFDPGGLRCRLHVPLEASSAGYGG